MTDLTDEQLLVRYRQGQTPAFEVLISRYKNELFHFLFRFAGNRQYAEDLFQETFLQVHMSAHTFDKQKRFKPWLFTIGANKARDHIRRSIRQSTAPLSATMEAGGEDGATFVDLLEAGLDLPLEQVQRREVQLLVQQVLMELPSHLREVLLLAYFHRFAYKEIADMLSIPLGTVKSRLHASVAAFGREWKKRFGDQMPED